SALLARLVHLQKLWSSCIVWGCFWLVLGVEFFPMGPNLCWALGSLIQACVLHAASLFRYSTDLTDIANICQSCVKPHQVKASRVDARTDQPQKNT
ncbi:hypothetical protein DFH06DRAFT_1170130, partial [Mycena polygramma]